jgi:hypothetical protein
MANRICSSCGASYVEWVTMCSDCGVPLVDPDQVEDPRELSDDLQVVYELGGWTLEQRTEVAEVMADSGIPHAWNDDELVVHVDHEERVDALLAPIEGVSPDDAGETEYDMEEWTALERTEVEQRLAEADVPFRWEGSLLLVPVALEAVVDDVLDDVELGGDAAARGDDGAETPFAVMESLFLAAVRLRRDPLDGDGLTLLASASDGADWNRAPFGVDLAVWRRVGGLVDDITDAITGGGESDPDAAEVAANALHDLLRDFV